MPSNVLPEQEFVAHLFAPLDGPDVATAYQQFATLWGRCRDELAMTCAIPSTGLPAELPPSPPAMDASGPICGIQDLQADFQAIVRREHDVLNLSLVFATPLAAPVRRARIGNAAPSGWPEYARWWRRLAGGGATALLGAVTVFQAKAARTAGLDLVAWGADAWALLPPDDADADGWWGRGRQVGDGLALWETSARDGDCAERRLVVLANPDEDAALSAFTWSNGGVELPPLGRYLMHAAKLRYEARVRGDATALRQLRERVDSRVGRITAGLGSTAPGLAAELATLAADEALLAGTMAHLRKMRRTVAIALDDMASAVPGPLASDARLGSWLTDQLADDAEYLDATREHAQRVREIARDQGIGFPVPGLRQPPSLLLPPPVEPTPVTVEPVEPRVAFGVDVADFGLRSTRQRLYARQRIAALVEQVLGAAGVRLKDTDRQDRGDGMLVVLPARIRSHLALPRLLRAWQEHLGADNEQHQDRLRVRVAMSLGHSDRSAIGVSDGTIGQIFELLGSPVLRTALMGEAETDLAVLVADPLYREVADARSPTLHVEEFDKRIVTAEDGSLFPAWFWSGTDHPTSTSGTSTAPAAPEPAADAEREPSGHRRRVLVISGPHDQASDRFRRFLRSLDLCPVDPDECVDATGETTPRRMDVVRAGLRSVQAVVVLLTPVVAGESAGDHSDNGGKDLPPDADVLLQAGLALECAPTLLVTVGAVRLPPLLRDHAHIPLDDMPETRYTIANRLKSAGCDVDQSGTDWLAPGIFSSLNAYHHTSANEPEKKMPNARDVFVIHGRDEQARIAVWDYLRAIDLHPLDWEEIVTRTKSGMPSLIEVLHKAFEENQAALVLMTPDDGALLHPSLRGPHELAYETELTGQGRPNVLFEAGMAMALQPDRTLIVEVGQSRPFSDVGGLNVVKFDGKVQALQKIAGRLRIAGCAVDTNGTDWLDVTRFAGLDAFTRHF